ncbi:hypothetical protein BOX30_05370 [Leptospirillum ferriphilum]|nr:hypothetical protein BOX30_05370 [Leptospirillum ferriphilum]
MNPTKNIEPVALLFSEGGKLLVRLGDEWKSPPVYSIRFRGSCGKIGRLEFLPVDPMSHEKWYELAGLVWEDGRCPDGF